MKRTLEVTTPSDLEIVMTRRRSPDAWPGGPSSTRQPSQASTAEVCGCRLIGWALGGPAQSCKPRCRAVNTFVGYSLGKKREQGTPFSA